MKKNKIMRLSAALLAVTLLTTCMANGIFAKYSSEGSGRDQTRVTKWGVTISAANNTMFDNKYGKDDALYTIGDDTVVGASGAKVIAPGTKGSLTKVSLGGSPEVAVKVKNEADILLSGWDVGGEYYCPLKVTVGSDVLYGLNYKSATLFVKAIKDKIDAHEAVYAPGTDLSKETGVAPNISWEWEFEGGNGEQINRTDAKDTALAESSIDPTISFKVKTTVTQVN